MKKHLLKIVFILLSVANSFSILAQSSESEYKINPEDIGNIKIRVDQIVNNFELNRERFTKLDKLSGNQISELRKRDKRTNKLILVENTHKAVISASSNCLQIWNRNKEDKIEINIFVCSSDSELNAIIYRFTKEYYSMPYIITDRPIIGEKTWIPKYEIYNTKGTTIMFKISNVFVRVFVGLTNQSNDEIKETLMLVSNSIMNNIIKEQH